MLVGILEACNGIQSANVASRRGVERVAENSDRR